MMSRLSLNISTPGIHAGFMSIVLILLFTNQIMAEEIDWSQVDKFTTTAFYPGVASWEFLRGEDHGKGAVPVRTLKKSCADCHIDQSGNYDINTDGIISGELKKSVSGAPLEPMPIPGTGGFRKVTVQAVHDMENLYLRIGWAGPENTPVSATGSAQQGFASVNLQLSRNVGSFRKYGCFIACHDDQVNMPDDKGNNTRLYTYFTRADGKLKPQQVLDQYLERGQFLDLWRVNIINDHVTTEDFHILADRSHDKNDLSATGEYKDGEYSVVMSRKLSTGDDRDIELRPGETFTIGIAIHDHLHRGRRHFTTFPLSVGISKSADITAARTEPLYP